MEDVVNALGPDDPWSRTVRWSALDGEVCRRQALPRVAGPSIDA